ncbi:hypothetical protein B0H13DRAFT_2325862 [Mycena leptocephala]|nr:hypothetical protein B0H13DRAFT_2325862 [Mycena leptocephala]
MAGPMFYLRPLLVASFFLIFVCSSTTAQTVTGTLFGIAYPTDIVRFANGAYNFPGPVVWIGNHPQIDILRVGNGQTSFSYHDVFTQNLGGGGAAALVPVTQNGTSTSSYSYVEPEPEPTQASSCKTPQAYSSPSQRKLRSSLSSKHAHSAKRASLSTPFFTFTAALPTAAPVTPSKISSILPSASAIGNGSRTRQPTKGATPDSTAAAPDSTATATHKVPVGAIVGAAIGIVALVGAGLAFLLLCRRRRRRLNTLPHEKVELDPEPAYASPFMHEAASRSSLDTGTRPRAASDARPRALPSSYAPSSADTSIHADADTHTRRTTAAAFTSPTPPETPRERRRRLKQMQVTVQQLQRNLTITQLPQTDGDGDGDGDGETQTAMQQRQIDMLLAEVERLRAIVARDEALPAYQEQEVG